MDMIIDSASQRMKFVAGDVNGVRLREIMENALSLTSMVKIAIPYANGKQELLDHCFKNKIPIVYYCRYDGTVAVSSEILETFLARKNPIFQCRLVPDILHAKVIWWEGYGAYIGSANLTDKAWYKNIEAGIFIWHEELLSSGIFDELNRFFKTLEDISYPLSDEILAEVKMLEVKFSNINSQTFQIKKDFSSRRLLPTQDGLNRFNKKDATSEQKASFIKEWQGTLQIMRDIGAKVSDDEHRPIWIDKSIPKGVQADQFLHAYYFEIVRDGLKSRHQEEHEINKNKIEGALIKTMDWWKSLTEPPGNEKTTIYEWAPYIREKLRQDNVKILTKEEFIQVCSKVHAVLDHSIRVSNEWLRLPAKQEMKKPERVKKFADLLFEQRSDDGKTPLEVINYVLYGGGEIWERLWTATQDRKYKISHLGLSSLGEMIGWALPNEYPPRNGRTSKALYALGYNVNIPD